MSPNKSRKDILVLDTNALINIPKKKLWRESLDFISTRYKTVIPTPALYEFQLGIKSFTQQEVELAEALKAAQKLDCINFIMAYENDIIKNGLYILNPSHSKWLTATNRMVKNIDLRNLNSKGIKKRHMDHIIYSTARNVFGTICTDDAKDFRKIAGIADDIGWHDGAMDVVSLSDILVDFDDHY
ncbi:MAG: hypothetical protein JEY79_06755 [Pseudodesulfovibrio sp.]|nr:hypothetical protein [Pseudodesulfovibrio sp.]